MLSFLFFLSSLLLVVADRLQGSQNGFHRNISSTVTLSIPSLPHSNRQIIDANFQSYSIEFSFMLDYAGDSTNPNRFSQRMLQNLHDISGSYPIIRSGGSTQNRAVYNASQKEALVATFSPNSPDQPSSLTIGPTWIESFQQFPKGTKYIYGLNFYDGEYGLNQTIMEAANAWENIAEDLYAFQIGNEVDGWPGGSRRPANYTVESYAEQWNEFADAIDEQVIGAQVAGEVEPIFDACTFEAPRNVQPNNLSIWNVESAIRAGIASRGHVKTVSDHDYMGAHCAGAPVPTIEDNLLNHHHMTSLMYYHEYLGNFSRARGFDYVLGETNSISCQGTPNISDVYAASIWSVDYTMYVAQLPVSRLFFHMGTGYRYSPWQPVEYNGTARYVKALYYGNLFTAAAFAGGNKQVEVLLNETSLTAYAIYNAEQTNSSDGGHAELESVAIVNMNLWNSTMDEADRPYIPVSLPSALGDWTKATVQRLTGSGVDTARNITFAGQAVDGDGYFRGDKQFENVNNGTVLVGAAEAVLVTL